MRVPGILVAHALLTLALLAPLVLRWRRDRRAHWAMLDRIAARTSAMNVLVMTLVAAACLTYEWSVALDGIAQVRSFGHVDAEPASPWHRPVAFWMLMGLITAFGAFMSACALVLLLAKATAPRGAE